MHEYVGRFAPSPTGPLHFGSLVAAVASYCDARANHGLWFVRMEDLDKPREMTGAAENILRTLRDFGFSWDDDVMYQSQRVQAYEVALQQLQTLNRIYACTCSRKEIVDSAVQAGIEGVIYPKTCLLHPPKPSKRVAYRLITENKPIVFSDSIQGRVDQNLALEIGDFVVKRADALFAYQLAVVVDDAEQNITHIVRGADLMHSTTRQIYLQQLLGLKTPQYAHVPIVINGQGEKLSKQTLASAINTKHANQLVYLALQFLGQQPPKELVRENLSTLWQWAITHWSLAHVPHQYANTITLNID
jgi:glutamyl-Q tRNA(Asp) synthetase